MKKFPNEFVWGSATSAYQIEGEAREDGKGDSIWDRFCRLPGRVANGDTGDVAINHYHLYKEDIQRMKQLNLQAYRFSVSWPRIFPHGTGEINSKGIDFYKRLVHNLLENNITPYLTLYHWDLPQALQDKGGWLNRDIISYFQEYSTYLFNELGDVVKHWITLNEPWVVSYLGHYTGEHAPGYHDFQSFLRVSHHLNLAHGAAVTAFRDEINGQIGITLNLTPSYPADQTEESKKAAQRYDGFFNRWFLDPTLRGTYPQDMLDHYAGLYDLSFIEDGDLKAIHQPIDFLGINYYSISTLTLAQASLANPLGVCPVDSGRPKTAMGWEIEAQGMYELLVRLTEEYDNIPLYITENGAAYDDHLEADDTIQDDLRLQYIRDHLLACYDALKDGANLKGYFLWSLFDNFEWAFGYDKRFGLIYVDYETQRRIPKKSAYWYKEIIQKNGVIE